MKSLPFTVLLLIISLSLVGLSGYSKVVVHPIHHSSVILQYNNLYIYVDPASEIEKYQSYPAPDIILITHNHGDHLKPELLSKIKAGNTMVIGSQTSIDQLGYGVVLMNGEITMSKGIQIEAIPMYNTTTERIKNHIKGVGNGYVLTIGNERIYISGDTEDIPEMRALKNIDIAFICMNLPFTMTPEQAASAVLDFQPKKVYPYHFSENLGFSNIEIFKTMVSKNDKIEVIISKWYDEQVQ